MNGKQNSKAKKSGDGYAENFDLQKAKKDKVRARAKHPIVPAQMMELIERISDGFVVFDAQMNYTYVNQRGGRTFRT